MPPEAFTSPRPLDTADAIGANISASNYEWIMEPTGGGINEALQFADIERQTDVEGPWNAGVTAHPRVFLSLFFFNKSLELGINRPASKCSSYKIFGKVSV